MRKGPGYTLWNRMDRSDATPRPGSLLAPRVLVPAILLGLALSLAPAGAWRALAANPLPVQVFYVSLPEDDLLQLFDDNDAAGGPFPDPVSPIRSVTGISIGSTGTWVYWDQWEDGGYEATLSEPGSNVYDASSNPDGTQIWGDGVLSNGCPPNIDNVANPCASGSDDELDAGEVIILDNNVVIAGSSGSYARNASQVYFDGRDRFGVTFPVAVTRAAWPPTPGSVMAGGNELLDRDRWGTSYEAPVGEDTPDGNTNAFQDTRWFIMAGSGGATIDVDANGDGDLNDANDLDDYVMSEGAKRGVDGILMGATLSVVSGSSVQVNSMTADVDDTFEFRWDALLPRGAWSDDYYTPVGTRPKADNSGCTEVEVYNPNATTITINYDFPGGSAPDGSFTVAAGATATGQTSPATPNVAYDHGARYWSQGGEDFLPLSVTDCTKDTSAGDGRLYDWGSPLFPVEQLTSEVVVGWAPGCSGDGPSLCVDADVPYPYSRSVVWITPVANTTLFVDFDGSGITCPNGTDADLAVSASALTSYRFHDDPYGPNNVLDQFDAEQYTNNDGNRAWGGDWTETGDNGSPSSGEIEISAGALTFDEDADANDAVTRSLGDLTAYDTARASFAVDETNIGNDDDIAFEASPDGSTWTTVATFDEGTSDGKVSYDLSAQIGSAMAVRFRMVDGMDNNGEAWSFDAVDVHYGDGESQGDFDMTAARIRTCDGTAIAAAWGQNPAYSGGDDEEALDLGTGIAPFGSKIAMEKLGDALRVPRGGLLTYTYEVRNEGTVALSGVTVADNRCSPATYSSGDTNTDGLLGTTEEWTFTCQANVYYDTTNVAYASGSPDGGTSLIESAPDEWTVAVDPPAFIGNSVWLDEDGDGVQDAGEAGIPNVLVTLTGTDHEDNSIVRTTFTDASGGYLFAGLPPSDVSGYMATVTQPSGLNQTYDEDGLGSANASTVVLGAGTEHLTADFGYNWAPSSDTDSPTLGDTGAIGDQVWIDADGDGVRYPGEAGLGGVSIKLFTDPDADGVYDTEAASTTTDGAGGYVFDGLTAGSYVVEVTPPTGYAQTGDPDDSEDDRTTSPIVLAPGDVYVNADFGYQPTGDSSDIGDTIWFDADGDGTYEPTGNGPGELDDEYGIAGVTVSLIRDLDNDGVWDPGEPVIATDITDENGLYRFPGLSAAKYIVWVNDTENVLGERAPSGDPDEGLANRSVLVVDGVADDLLQDFGYTGPGHTASDGLIGDTVFLDRDADDSFDPGEGLEGVTVRLYEADGSTLLATTYTDENGNYAFGGLEPSTTYVVKVDPATLPTGVTNTVDPDGGTANESTVNLATSGPVNLLQDFAYRDASDPNAISGTLWDDTDADGTLEGAEPGRFPGITVVLRNTDGDVVATTWTDSNGDFSFANLPDGTYSVDVTDEANLLDGTWKSDGPGAGSDNNSQVEPYQVAVTGGQTNATADFGYYLDPAALGDFVWDDLDGDGVQDVGEPGIYGVDVTLTITYPSGDVVTVVTTTDKDGAYTFDNLLLDEDYAAATAAGTDPTYSISRATPAGYAPSPTNVGSDATDSDGSPTAATVTQGATDDTYDFGFVAPRSIGDRVWHDLDRDGVQDGAEPGLSNVTVNLYLDDGDGDRDAGDTLVATTYTDTHGEYLFDGLLPDVYWVEVDDATVPTVLAVTYDEDNGTSLDAIPGGPDDVTKVDLTTGPADHLTADFGYGGAGVAVIGDRVWHDVDGDGVQDPNEPGIPGVSVQVTPPSGVEIGGGAGNPITVVTGEDGIWMVSVPSGGDYDVVVTPPTGYDAAPTNGPATRTLAVEAGYDSLYGDFGFGGGDTGTIGDRVWNDVDGDGVQDGGELAIEGVTVALIRDLDGDGEWEAGEPIVATDTTDRRGSYLFEGLPATDGGGSDDYLVWVNDTAGALDQLEPTYDRDAAGPGSGLKTGYGITAVKDLTPSGVDDVDFGYRAPGASIGNFVWHDLNGDGVFGIAVVDGAVDWDNDGVVGDDGDDGQYAGVRIIDGRADVNDDGTIDADDDGWLAGIPVIDGTLDLDGRLPEPGIGGVTVQLRVDVDDDGDVDPEDTVVKTTTTDAMGAYLFVGLPGGDYLVDVDGASGVLSGFTKTTGPSAGSDDNSQADPYAVTLAANTSSDLTGDFGYEGTGPSYSITGNVFEDVDNDGGTPATEDYEHGSDGLNLWSVVYLYRDLDGDGVLDPDEPLIATTTPSSEGTGPDYDNYGLHNLPPGDYILVADATPMFYEGYRQTTQQGTDPNTAKHHSYEAVTIGSADVADVDFGFHKPGSQTTPVTVANFVATKTAGGVRLAWSTATETGNVGFNLYAETEAGPVLLTEHVVPSQAVDSLAPLSYEVVLDGVDATAFSIEDVDILGRTRRHGPFALGEAYGAQPRFEPIDWVAIRSEHDAIAAERALREALAGARLVQTALGEADVLAQPVATAEATAVLSAGPTAESASGGRVYPIAVLRVRRDGVVRVTYEQLRDAGIDLAGVSRARLSLTNRGQGVPIFVNKTFGPGAYVEFVGRALDTLYTDTNVYLLAVTTGRPVQAVFDTRPVNAFASPPTWYEETVEVNKQTSYFFAARGDDPWVASSLLAFEGRPVASTHELLVDGYVPGAARAVLGLELVGATDWPANPDHHVIVKVNGTRVAETRFDGLADESIRAELPDGVLREGTNQIEVIALGDTGVRHDLVHVDRYRVTYPRVPRARGGALDLALAGTTIRVDGLPSADVTVYRMGLGRVTRVARPKVEARGDAFSVTFPGTPWPSRYIVATADAAIVPEIAAWRSFADITSGAAELLIISHPDFVPALRPLADARRAEGLTVRIVDVRDVYDRFGHGVFDPAAIRAYIRHAAAEMGTRYVLLGGGDTYDYRDYTGAGSMSFIPSLYAATDEIVRFAPVDPLYADLDGDGVQDLAIGRMPARTVGEMTSLVAKTLQYGTKTYQKTAVFVADEDDDGAPFTQHSSSFVTGLPSGWQVTQAAMGRMGKAPARSALVDAINRGVALTSFVGHSSPTDWTFDRLFTASDAAKLTNAGRPTVVTQWGCWNTYYVSPAAETLAHRFLLSGDRGAAAVLGASTLTLSSSEARLGALVTPRIVEPGTRIGDAILSAKQTLATRHDELPDVQLGWTLLGDPTLIVEPGAP